jgi:fatty acid desaturase
VITQFSSLQHEVLHGHPFANKPLNEALVFPALMLVMPYERFRDLHLQHHFDPNLTDPLDDPESNFHAPDAWARLSWPAQKLYRFNNTLFGRMTVGPAISIRALIVGDWRLYRQGTPGIARAWVLNAFGMVPVFWWLGMIGTMPLWAYALAVYLGYSLLKIRTYLEHRAHEASRARTVVVEDRGPLSILFLNNNFHVVHHMHPTIAWYRLPALYAARREHYLRRNEAYVYRSYGEIFRQYLFRAKDPVPHPIYPVHKVDRADAA